MTTDDDENEEEAAASSEMPDNRTQQSCFSGLLVNAFGLAVTLLVISLVVIQFISHENPSLANKLFGEVVGDFFGKIISIFGLAIMSFSIASFSMKTILRSGVLRLIFGLLGLSMGITLFVSGCQMSSNSWHHSLGVSKGLRRN